MDDDQTPINGAPERRRRIPAVVEDAALTLEDKLFWRIGDAFKAVFEVVSWPFERVGWKLQRALIWPLQDRTDELSGRGRALAVGGSVVAVAIVAVGALALATSGGSGSRQTAAQVAVVAKPAAKVSTTPAPKPKAPTLHGAAPVFKAPAPKSSSGVNPARPIEAPSAQSSAAATSTASAATGKISSDPSSSASTPSADAARASTVTGPPAGAKAIAVAREFSNAFVVYETGGEKSEISPAFAATATPELSRALLKRPPRLPANVKVPKAKVLNIVAGPSQGGVYSLSVSLLRVGVTSELRLEMEKLKGEGWRVTNVLG
jgi:hypothetical protein